MERITLEEERAILKNKSIGDDKFIIYSNGNEYTFKMNKTNDNLNLFVLNEDTMENYENFFTLSEIISTQCFIMEEDIDEIKNVIMQYVLENKVRFVEDQNKNGIELIFESQFNLKKLKSVFFLKQQEENIQNNIKLLKIKMNNLAEDNKTKDKIIKKLEKENQENLNKINAICEDVKKMKEIQESQSKMIIELKEKEKKSNQLNINNNKTSLSIPSNSNAAGKNKNQMN
jgi:hypothetical protein